MEPAEARTLKSLAEREARKRLLDTPRARPLATYAQYLRSTYGVEVPDFDPLNGGVDASVLFLFEKPGPMTSESRLGRSGSGFISRDNDDPTAEATFNFMLEAGIPRGRVIIWNVVPGWNGTRKITAQELRDGVSEVANLTALLPALEAIVLVGLKAQRAASLLVPLALPVFHSPHPSPLVRASRPEQWACIPTLWAEAYGATKAVT